MVWSVSPGRFASSSCGHRGQHDQLAVLEARHAGNVGALAGHDQPASGLEAVVHGAQLDLVPADGREDRCLGQGELLTLGEDFGLADLEEVVFFWIEVAGAASSTLIQ